MKKKEREYILSSIRDLHAGKSAVDEILGTRGSLLTDINKAWDELAVGISSHTYDKPEPKLPPILQNFINKLVQVRK